MNFNKKAVNHAMILALSTVLLGIVAGTAEYPVATEVVAEAEEAVTEGITFSGRAAGVVLSLEELEESALEELQTAEVIRVQKVVVTAAEAVETVPDGPIYTEEERLWLNRVMADVKSQMNVREAADGEAKIVGRFRKGDVAELLEAGEEWTRIRSGNVEGYVRSSYLVYGLDALAYANENIDIRATITGKGVRVRREANAESGIVASLSKGSVLIVEPDAEVVEGWVAVRYTGKTRYVSADYVEITHATSVAITIEEEKEIARKKAEEEAKRKAAQTTEINIVQNPSYDATTDEILLLAALIQCEAGGECYEGKVAVGNVVLNRVRSSRYPNSITEVVYAPGQFTPARSGKVDRVMAAGPKESCIKAAQEAVNGVDYTAGAVSFRQAKSGRAGLRIGNHVFF